MSRNYFKSGDWNVICDVCSKKIKASESKMRWDGFIVCKEDFEIRHPQDFIRTKQDKITVPFSRPRTTDQFVEVSYVTIYVSDDYVDSNYFEESII